MAVDEIEGIDSDELTSKEVQAHKSVAHKRTLAEEKLAAISDLLKMSDDLGDVRTRSAIQMVIDHEPVDGNGSN